MTAAARKPHVHAEVIKAWADGATVEVWDIIGGGKWLTLSEPYFWNADHQYRVKPEKVYPVTLMSYDDLRWHYNEVMGGPIGEALARVANAALKHAINAQQVIPMPEVQEVARNLNADQHKKELQAVAEAVYLKCLNAVTPCSGAAAHELRKQTDVILGEVGK